MQTYLKMPSAGGRDGSSANTMRQNERGYYWSSSRYTVDYAYNLVFDSSTLNSQSANIRASGFSVRCLKNSPVAPTSSWTTLYD